MTSYPINEIFVTLQGEANFTGQPAIFVRLQGCDVACPWCDTKHTWQMTDQQVIDIKQVLSKKEDNDQFCWLSTEELVGQIHSTHPRVQHVVMTGGEPAKHPLLPITQALIEQGFFVQIETSGTETIDVHADTWVTLSPKLGMPSQKMVLKENLLRANEIKLPIGKEQDYRRYQAWLKSLNYQPTVDLWLQPLSQNPSATELCTKLAIEYGHRVSIQVHRYLGIR
jgi:7-carboxy-7-deazaguanine synthase